MRNLLISIQHGFCTFSKSFTKLRCFVQKLDSNNLNGPVLVNEQFLKGISAAHRPFSAMLLIMDHCVFFVMFELYSLWCSGVTVGHWTCN